MTRGLLAALAVMACKPDDKPQPPSTTSRPIAISIDAAIPVITTDAAQPTPAPAPPLPVTPPARHGWLDLPAWHTGNELELTWRVTLVHDSHDPESSKQPLSLVMTIGDVSRALTFPKQLGDLKPSNQPICKTSAYPLARNEVAKITFYEGGAGGFLVRRTQPDVLAIVDWFQTDGACPTANGEPGGPCPAKEKPVVKLHVPPHVTIHESIVEIDNGVPKPFDCLLE